MKANIPILGLMAAGLAACGGGLLAVLQIVTPLGGQWSGGATTIQFTNLQPSTQIFCPRSTSLPLPTPLTGFAVIR